MSSIFVRPDSPPPRAPSPPPYPFTSLPSPSSRSSRKPSSSSSAPSLPPDLRRERRLLTVRSYEHLSSRKRSTSPIRQPKRIRSALSPSSSRTHSLPETLIEPIIPTIHCRSRSFTRGVGSPSSSSSKSHSPPPVPPLPTFILTPADKSFPDATRQPPLISPNDLPALDCASPISGFTTKSKGALERTKSAGVTCLKFLAMRNSLKGSRW